MDWEDYNYPPCLRILHYNLDDVEDGDSRGAVQWAHLSYIGVIGALLLNLLVNLVLAFGGVAEKGVDAAFSFFNCVIVGTVGMYSFYHGYKGMATNNMRFSWRYLVIQGAMMVFMLLGGVLGAANFNGVSGLGRASGTEDLEDFWRGASIAESSLWLANILVGGVSFYKVLVHRQQGRPSILSQL
mgnify:CR=1 FL=1